jgi:predicted RNA binding protein YcfA (HicA-like mRNA interferase family)
MGKRQPLTAAEVERGLKAAGFEEQPKTGTSHVKWKRYAGDTKYIVTVDAHHAPFSQQLIASMASQAGLSVKQFYELCSKDGAKQAKRGKLEWLTALFSRDQ